MRSKLGIIVVFILLLLALGGPVGTDSVLLGAGNAGGTIYLPLTFGPAPDLTITHLEVTQSVQRVDNSVPLVAGRSTVVRVFAKTIVGPPTNNVMVTLAAWRGGKALEALAPLGPRLVPTATSRADYNSSFNFLLPEDWLQGSIVVVATVDSAGAVAESNESNNSLQASFTFNHVPPLDIKIVPIDYTHLGSVNPGLYPGQRVNSLAQWIQRAFPVNSVLTSFSLPHLAFQGNLTLANEWQDLLWRVTDRKQADFAPGSQVYYGLVPTSNGSTQWFTSGFAGIGWVGYRESVGLNANDTNATGKLAAHEIGHNMGRLHAPCGGASGIDGSYPYNNASIGQFGVDISGGANPLRNPSAYYDVMGYCEPAWISDYTYQALYTDQRANGLAAFSPAGYYMLVRVRFDEQGTPRVMPVYTAWGSPPVRDGQGAYDITLRDGAGNVIASHPASFLKAAEEGISAQAIYATIPLPAAKVAAVELAGPQGVMATRSMVPTAVTVAGMTAPAASDQGMILAWDQPEVPVLVRYVSADGQNVSTLGVDLLGGSLAVSPDIFLAGPGKLEIIPADSPPQAATSATLHLP